MAVANPVQVVTSHERLSARIDELEARIAALEAERPPEIDYGALFDTHEECVTHRCSYFRHYLAYGPADLTHEGYHAAERCLETHIKTCRVEYGRCRIHMQWEERLRA